MEDGILKRLDQMITKHELLLAKAGARRGEVPEVLMAQIERLETGLYALRQGVHGFLRAKECGFPLEPLERYMDSLEVVAVQAENSLLSAIAELAAFAGKGRPA